MQRFMYSLVLIVVLIRVPGFDIHEYVGTSFSSEMKSFMANIHRRMKLSDTNTFLRQPERMEELLLKMSEAYSDFYHEIILSDDEAYEQEVSAHWAKSDFLIMLGFPTWHVVRQDVLVNNPGYEVSREDVVRALATMSATSPSYLAVKADMFVGDREVHNVALHDRLRLGAQLYGRASRMLTLAVDQALIDFDSDDVLRMIGEETRLPLYFHGKKFFEVIEGRGVSLDELRASVTRMLMNGLVFDGCELFLAPLYNPSGSGPSGTMAARSLRNVWPSLPCWWRMEFYNVNQLVSNDFIRKDFFSSATAFGEYEVFMNKVDMSERVQERMASLMSSRYAGMTLKKDIFISLKEYHKGVNRHSRTGGLPIGWNDDFSVVVPKSRAAACVSRAQNASDGNTSLAGRLDALERMSLAIGYYTRGRKFLEDNDYPKKYPDGFSQWLQDQIKNYEIAITGIENEGISDRYMDFHKSRLSDFNDEWVDKSK